MRTLEAHVAASVVKAKAAVSSIDGAFALATRPPEPTRKTAGNLLAYYSAHPPADPVPIIKGIRAQLASKLADAEGELRAAGRTLRGYEQAAKALQGQGRVEDCPEHLRAAVLALKADANSGGQSALEVAEQLVEACAHGRQKLWAAKKHLASIRGAAVVAAKTQGTRLMRSSPGYERLGTDELVMDRLRAAQKRRKTAFQKAQRAADRSAR